MAIGIGISGWRYRRWRGTFYPAGLAQRREPEYAAGCFPRVEINGSFYSLWRPESVQRWHDKTPDAFIFSVKGRRLITHMKRLGDCEQALASFFACVMRTATSTTTCRYMRRAMRAGSCNG
nr:DUF72 domain-containing protein [Xanthomonas prunicola]